MTTYCGVLFMDSTRLCRFRILHVEKPMLCGQATEARAGCVTLAKLLLCFLMILPQGSMTIK